LNEDAVGGAAMNPEGMMNSPYLRPFLWLGVVFLVLIFCIFVLASLVRRLYEERRWRTEPVLLDRLRALYLSSRIFGLDHFSRFSIIGR
jgi:nitrate reductase gamma subunit